MTFRFLLLSLVAALGACTAVPSDPSSTAAVPSASPQPSCAHAGQATRKNPTPQATPATWSDADIRASRTTQPSERPAAAAPPHHLLAVFEAGDCQLTLIDAERWEVVRRFPVGAALLQPVRASPDGRYVYVGAEDGWVTQLDLHRLTVAAQVRVGLRLRHLALSSDGRFLAAANDVPNNLVLLSADLQPIKQMDSGTLDGKHPSRIAALRDAPQRKSFVAALEDVAEVWEIAYDQSAPPIFDGLVHDYRMGEGIAKPGFLNARRTPLEQPLADFAFDDGHHQILGVTGRPPIAAASTTGTTRLQVINLDIRRKITELTIAGWPNVGGGLRMQWNGRRVLVSPNREASAMDVIDLRSWKLAKTIPLPGLGRFAGGSDGARYFWADATQSQSAQDTLTLIDTHTLEPGTTLRAPGKLPGPAAFTRDGRSLVAGIQDGDGALVVWDLASGKEIKRLPMRQPLGVTPLWNQSAQPKPAAR